jgi:outer membrane protein OmpA-like peptidoglycan-associated protein
MSSHVKLLVGFIATFVVAALAFGLNRSPLLSDLGSRSAEVMAANGITDGRASWIADNGWTYRRARLSGTADPATRTRTLAAVAALDGVHDAVWVDAPPGVAPPPPPPPTPKRGDCRQDLAAIIADRPLAFGDNDAQLTADAEAVIDTLAARLRDCRGLRFAVTVHAAPSRSSIVGLSLSQARADAIVDALARRGLDTRNYEPIGLGTTQSTAGGTSKDADWIEFVFRPGDTAMETR